MKQLYQKSYIVEKTRTQILQSLFFKKYLRKKVPRVPYATIGGEDGLKMTRAAFALMIKFGDLLEDFTFMVD